MTDGALARALATAVGEVLVTVQRSGLLTGKDLGAAGDALAQSWIQRVLATVRPEDAVLSEEAASDPARLDASRVWIVDPLDGTREFAEGRSDWAVHIALVLEGRLSTAAVALPGQGLTLSTDRSVAAAPAPAGPLQLLVSRTRAPAVAQRVAERLGADLVPMGSAGAKAMAVVQGRAHAYLHAGGQYEWDSAAPVGIASHAGLHVSRLDGSPLRYNQPDPYLPDLLVCRTELADALLAAVETTL